MMSQVVRTYAPLSVSPFLSDFDAEGIFAASGSKSIAVVDVGSNSTRMEVLELTSDYDLRVLSEVKSLLRLQSRMTKDGRLSQPAVDDLTRVLRDFSVVAKASRVDRVSAVATSSLRSAVNGKDVIEAIRRDTGMNVEIISGYEEARHGFLGAIFSLPVYDGVLVDIGGGSVEFSFFERRKLSQVFTLELGALRVSNDHLKGDPPSRSEVKALREQVRSELEDSGIPSLCSGATLVGTGGTIRNLAKMDRAMRRNAFSRLHGVVIKFNRLKKITTGLRGLDKVNTAHVAGLNPDRADSILGGALVMSEIARYFDRRPLVVSGRGLREGLVLSSIMSEPPDVEDVRRRSIYALGRRFDTWDLLRADRRAALVRKMTELLPDALGDEMSALMVYAARNIDTGRSINYYDRYRHAAKIIEQGELGGFLHRDIGLMSAAIRYNDVETFTLNRYRPHITRKDLPVIRRAAVILRLADEMERRLDALQFSRIEMRIAGDKFQVKAPELDAWRPGRLVTRFRRAFKLGFEVTP